MTIAWSEFEAQRTSPPPHCALSDEAEDLRVDFDNEVNELTAMLARWRRLERSSHLDLSDMISTLEEIAIPEAIHARDWTAETNNGEW